MQCSSSLRTVAIALGKIANDIRWLASGPQAGLGELSISAVQPGSSIMPGKVNPVIIESVIQVTAQVLGNDLTVSLAGQGGYFELNTMMPVAAFNLLQSITLISTSTRNFASRCVSDIKATNVGPNLVEQGLMLATGLTRAIGYDKATAIAKEAAASGRTIRVIRLSLTVSPFERGGFIRLSGFCLNRATLSCLKTRFLNMRAHPGWHLFQLLLGLRHCF